MRRSRTKKRFLHPFWPIIVIFLVVVVGGLAAYHYYESSTAADKKQANLAETAEVNGYDKSNSAEEKSKDDQKEQNASEAFIPLEEAVPTFFAKNRTIEEKVNSLLEDMSLQEKIGQLLVVGFQSSQVDEHIKKMIQEYKVGGVILFDRNMKDPKQVALLNNELQTMALENKHQIPLTLSVDQEGGQIIRMKDKVSPIPSQQTLGQIGDSKKVYDLAYRTGKELSAMGFNVNFAPVLDLSDTDSRSFGEDPEKTGTLGSQVVTGLMDSGIVATLKHFPGNGRSNIDPHMESSSVQADKGNLRTTDIYPFKQIIDAKDNNRFYVMVTHIKYPAYDRQNPASISSIIIQELLRKELGFTGIVVTDDLEMGAVSKHFTYEDLGSKAVEAGADMLLVCHTFENQQKVYNGIEEAVKSGQLSEERINEAVKRILTNKLTVIQDTEVDPAKAEAIVGK